MQSYGTLYTLKTNTFKSSDFVQNAFLAGKKKSLFFLRAVHHHCFCSFEGRLQLEADRHTENIKKRDTQVKSLASSLELEGYDRTPLNERQLQSFHRQVKERLDQDSKDLNQTMVDKYPEMSYILKS